MGKDAHVIALAENRWPYSKSVEARVIMVKECQQRVVNHPWTSKRGTASEVLCLGGSGGRRLLEPRETCPAGKRPNRSFGLF